MFFLSLIAAGVGVFFLFRDQFTGQDQSGILGEHSFDHIYAGIAFIVWAVFMAGAYIRGGLDDCARWLWKVHNQLDPMTRQDAGAALDDDRFTLPSDRDAAQFAAFMREQRSKDKGGH